MNSYNQLPIVPNRKLSFCITCKNRLHQIKETLYPNLENNRHNKSNLEFVLLDFESSDGLLEWMTSNFDSDLEEGYLKYFYTNQLTSWHASIAKNTAHLYASGEILVNLDCDNYTGIDGGYHIINTFDDYKDREIIVHQFSGKYGDGSYGRIAIRSEIFYKIGGYDESFEPSGFQDGDLIMRAISSGATYVHLADSSLNKAILNTKEEGIKYTNSLHSYEYMNINNKNRSFENINSGFIVANKGRFGIKDKVFQYISGKMVIAKKI